MFIINSFFSKLLSLLRLTQRLQKRAKSNIPKLSTKTSVNLRPMSRRWPVGILSRAQSTSKRFKMTFWNCGPLSRLYPKSAQTKRTALSPCMKASCVLWIIPIPTPVPLLAAAVHPPSSFDHKLLVSLRLPHSLQIRFPYYTWNARSAAPRNTAAILPVFISISFMKLLLREQPSRTRMHFSLELARVPLVSRLLKAFCPVVLTLLLRLRVIVVRLLNTTNQSSSLSAVAVRPSLSFLSTRPQNRTLKLS